MDDDAPAASELTPRRLRSVCFDLLGRPPLPAEWREWRGKPLQQFVDANLGTHAFWRHWYQEQLYYFLLIDGFRPASSGVVTIPKELAQGILDVRTALHRTALSPSFDLRNPGADTFVTVVLEQIVGEDVQKLRGELEIGKSLYDGKAGTFLGEKGQSQSDVVRIAIEHPQCMRGLVQRDYERVLHVPVEPRELRRMGKRLHRDPLDYLELLREWLASDTYLGREEHRRPLSNRQFVRALYVDLLGRLPEESESRAMRAALDGLADSRPLRSVLTRLLLDSTRGDVPLPAKEDIESPTRWVAELFVRLLGREARPAELKHFVTLFQSPACRPQTIAYALFSSAEYHHD